MYLYRKEGNESLDSASNYLTAIILVFLVSFIGTIGNIMFSADVNSIEKFSRYELFLIIVPVFIVLSFVIKRTYKQRIKMLDVNELSKVLKFNLFTLWVFMLMLIFLPIVLPKLIG